MTVCTIFEYVSPTPVWMMPCDVVQVTVLVFGLVRGVSTVGQELTGHLLADLDGRDVVFVRTAKGFKARPVTVGARSAGHAAIVAGLKPGETIATTNAFFLKAEMRKPTGEDE